MDPKTQKELLAKIQAELEEAEAEVKVWEEHMQAHLKVLEKKSERVNQEGFEAPLAGTTNHNLIEGSRRLRDLELQRIEKIKAIRQTILDGTF
ncbi:hypothetical protein [Pseudosulfitobacter sp. DSM 107133]|uniref:hypothetical protein n=1 Tax=Pseudosulfitobacter sp. DSM 107133 TaxID=2883100 RepID=UPI000DF172BD|nr:hypothetical protein [Pseudosulfitobacter sp. DSM 107133]UOA30218.1 hypothetical protein DSM107133_04982 [Pseudosulfitobacter sp. DSM 107133]